MFSCPAHSDPVPSAQNRFRAPGFNGGPHKARLTNGPLPDRRRVLALTVCLGIGLLLGMPGTAWGISGYASGGSAVAAQYPDVAALQSAGPKPDISDLAEVIDATRSSGLGAQGQAGQRAVVRHELQALSSGAGVDLRQTGSIALLIAGIAVVLVGGVLRWRRST